MNITFLKYCRFFYVSFTLVLTSISVYADTVLEEKSEGALLNTIVPIDVTDLAGRNLRFDKNPQRIILGESRYLFALSILDKEDPLQRIAGMLADLKQIDYGSYQQYQQKFPHIDAIPHVGHTSADSFSIEKVLSLNADLAIFGVDGHGPSARHAQLIGQLQKAGVQVVFIDFRNDPIVNTVKSIRLLGKILGREQRANEFIQFYEQQLTRVSTRLATLTSQQHRPDVFLHSRVGVQDLCCETMVRGMMATFIQQAGGDNIATPLIPGSAGVINLEYVLTRQPDVYIATAIGSIIELSDQQEDKDSNQPPYIALGAGVDEGSARESFQQALKDSGLSELDAIKSKKAYAIWHHFYNTPLNIVAVQVFAKWLYPQVFSDIDPRQTLEVLFDRFQSVPLKGVYWITLEAGHEKVAP